VKNRRGPAAVTDDDLCKMPLGNWEGAKGE